MAIVNRDLDSSEQKYVVNVNLGAVATGVTRFLWASPTSAALESVRYLAAGVSNAMQVAIEKVPSGAGASGIAMGISNLVLQNTSTSGIPGFSGLAAPGSTLLNLSQGDRIVATSSVANGNATELFIQLVVKKTQDIVALWGRQ